MATPWSFFFDWEAVGTSVSLMNDVQPARIGTIRSGATLVPTAQGTVRTCARLASSPGCCGAVLEPIQGQCRRQKTMQPLALQARVLKDAGDCCSAEGAAPLVQMEFPEMEHGPADEDPAAVRTRCNRLVI